MEGLGYGGKAGGPQEAPSTLEVSEEETPGFGEQSPEDTQKKGGMGGLCEAKVQHGFLPRFAESLPLVRDLSAPAQ